MEKRNTVVSLICAAVFAFFYRQCDEFMEAGAYWPQLICMAGMSLSLLEAAIEGFRWLRARDKQQPLNPFTPRQMRRILFLLCVMILWIWGLQTVGFLVSALAALIAVSVAYDPDRSARSLAIDAVCSSLFGTACYLLFKYLGILFPNTWLL